MPETEGHTGPHGHSFARLPLLGEGGRHMQYLANAGAVFAGREELQQEVAAYLEGDALLPGVLLGAMGSGKTALAAHALSLHMRQNSSLLIIPHFAGLTRTSRSLRLTLKRWCVELITHYGFTSTGVGSRVGEEDAAPLPVPEETGALMHTFIGLLNRVPAGNGFVLLVDGLDDFDGAGDPDTLAWLPQHLTPQVRVLLTARTSLETGEPLARGLRFKSCHTIYTGPLEPGDVPLIAARRAATSSTPVDTADMEFLIRRPGSRSVRFLVDVLRDAGAGERGLLAGLPNAQADEPETAAGAYAVRRLMAREQRHGEWMTREIAMACALARQGMETEELVALVARETSSAPDAIWSQMEGLLADMTGILLLRDGFWRPATASTEAGIAMRYMDSQAIRRAGHRKLAAFFAAQEDWTPHPGGDAGRALPNIRKLIELPWHYQHATAWRELELLLTSLSFLAAKAEAGMVFELADDFASASLAAPADRDLSHILILMEEALRRDLLFIARRPATLFQCLWNTCWWHDALESAAHFERPAEGWPSGDPPWESTSPKLSAGLTSWRASLDGMGSPLWLRELRPPAIHLSAARKAVLRGHDGAVRCVAPTPDGQRIVTAGEDGSIRIWRTDTGQEQASFRPDAMPEGPNALALPGNGDLVAVGHGGKTIAVFDAATGAKVCDLRGHRGAVLCLASSPDEKFVASGSVDGRARLWRAGKLKRYRRLRHHKSPVSSVGFSPDGKLLLTGAEDGLVRVWNALTGRLLHIFRGHTGSVTGVCAGPNGRQVVSGSRDGSIRVWDIATGEQMACCASHAGPVTGVCLSRFGRRILSASEDGSIRVWHSETCEELACLRGHRGPVTDIAYIPGGTRLVSVSTDGTARVWNTEPGCVARAARQHERAITAMAFSPDGAMLVSLSGQEGMIMLWLAGQGRWVRSIHGEAARRAETGFSADGLLVWQRFWSEENTEGFRVWEARNGRELRYIHTCGGLATCVSSALDHALIVTGELDGVVRVWDGPGGSLKGSMLGHSERVTSILIMPDNYAIASGSTDGTVRIWSIATGDTYQMFTGHAGGVQRLAHTSGSGQLAVWSGDGLLHLWDLRTGVRVMAYDARFYHPSGRRSSCFFSLESDEHETRLIMTPSGQPAAWLPYPSRLSAAHPGGRVWALAEDNILHIVALEGAAK